MRELKYGEAACDCGTSLVYGTHLPGCHLAAQTPRWVHVASVDEMEQHYRNVLPAVRAVARELGYAIGQHGSLRRDFDLMAMPWRDGAADKDTLARAIQKAACGFEMTVYAWEQKPAGRFAVSFPICWTGDCEELRGKLSIGHIDLSVMQGSPATTSGPTP